MYVRMYVCMYVCVCMCMHVYVCDCMCMYVYACLSGMDLNRYIYIIYIYTRRKALVCAQIDVGSKNPGKDQYSPVAHFLATSFRSKYSWVLFVVAGHIPQKMDTNVDFWKLLAAALPRTICDTIDTAFCVGETESCLMFVSCSACRHCNL